MPDKHYIHDNPENALPAAVLLATLWDEAREIAALKRQIGGRASEGAGLGWATPDNVAGIHVFEEDGGWAADMTIDGVAKGMPTCIGSKAPLRTRASAVTFATALLADIVLCQARRTRLPPAIWPANAPIEAFAYDGQALPLPKDSLDALKACGAERISEAYVRRRLAEVRRDLLGDGVLTPERLSSMGEGNRRTFLTVCALASVRGIAGWHEAPATPVGATAPTGVAAAHRDGLRGVAQT